MKQFLIKLAQWRAALKQIPIYQRLTAVWAVTAVILLGYHWLTGQTPPREAFKIAALDFAVYWYGIVASYALVTAAFLMQHLAQEQGRQRLFEQVPPLVRQRPLATIDAPESMQQIWRQQKLFLLGDLLLALGFGSTELGLNKAGEARLREILLADPDIDPAWVNDPAWRSWSPELVWLAIPWVVVIAIIGARLYHVFTPSPSMAAVGIHSPLDYFRSPLRLINLRNGGLGIYGGIAGGILGLYIFCRRYKVSLSSWLDLSAVAMLLGQTIGRWANFFNQELYGAPTTMPWAIFIDQPYRLDAVAQYQYFHPTFLYESLWNLVGFLLLYRIYQAAYTGKSRFAPGDLPWLYFFWYGVGRILLEMVRLDSRTGALGIPVASLVSFAMVLLGAAVVGYRLWQRQQ